MTIRFRCFFTHATLVCLLALNLLYFADAALAITRGYEGDIELFHLAVSALSQQLGWIVLIVWLMFRTDCRFPALIAIAIGMFTGNALCSAAKWQHGQYWDACMNSTAGMATCGIIVLAATMSLISEQQRTPAR